MKSRELVHMKSYMFLSILATYEREGGWPFAPRNPKNTCNILRTPPLHLRPKQTKEEGQKILELVHTEDFALERFFNQLDTTPTCALPAACALPELPAPRPECPRSTNANDLEAESQTSDASPWDGDGSFNLPTFLV